MLHYALICAVLAVALAALGLTHPEIAAPDVVGLLLMLWVGLTVLGVVVGALRGR